VRRHAKASTKRSHDRGTTRDRSSLAGFPVRGPLLLVGLLLALAFSAQPAVAGTTSGRQFLFSFDGSDAGAGHFTRVESIDVDQASGAVYVASEFEGKPGIAKFHPDGTAWNFSATGTPVLFGTGIQTFENGLYVAVDNTGGPNDGRIIVGENANNHLYAFAPSGSLLWSTFSGASGGMTDVAVDSSGHPWVNNISSGLYEFANTGSPPEQIAHESPSGALTFRLEFDASGNGYTAFNSIERYAGGDFSLPPTVFDSDAAGSYADPSSTSGHIFTVGATAEEYESGGSPIGSFGEGYYDSPGYGAAEGILAYNSNLDRVYIGQIGFRFENSVVEAFGPSLPSGTVPDATVEAVTETSVSHATVHGKVNPRGVPNAYRFEWKPGAESSWATAKSSPPVSLPEDGVEHAVEYQITALSGNTPYEARLVTENTEKGLDGFSTSEEFTTPPPAAPPAPSIDAITATTTTAHINGTIDPQGDATTWRLQTSTDPECLTGFTSGVIHTIPSEAPGTVDIEEALSGLLPDAHYCVRIEAENSAGSATSAVSEFTTDVVRPDVVTAFAAPRTETTARINARVNAEGAPLTYHFEYSDNAGSSWVVRPTHEDSSGSRDQFVVSDELTGLIPGKDYLYRVEAENSAGEAAPQGEIKEFTTRASGEMALPGRGIELVNNPDKGNQNVAAGAISLNGSGIVFRNGAQSFASDGNRAFWTAASGIPGGTAGVGNPFVATRTATGWHSENLLPPGGELEGGGDVSFTPVAATNDLSKFILTSGAVIQVPTWHEVMRIDLDHHQERLSYQPNAGNEGNVDGGLETDTTTDLEHVVGLDNKTGQIVDAGAGTPEVVSLMPDGNPAPCGVPAEGHGFFGDLSPGKHWIATTDASRVFFLTPDGACSGNRSLFVRNRDAGVTVEIAAGTSADVQFVRASPDGQTAIFLSKDPLVGEDANSDYDIYRWREGQGITCLTCVVADAQLLEAGGRAPTVRASDDLSHVYFESSRQLVPGLGAAGQSNLYVVAGGAVRFVAETRTHEGNLLDERAEGIGASGQVPPRLSRDGNVLVFSSTRELTSDRLGKECVVESRVEPCQAIYRYDDRDGSLECISCRPNGVTEANAGTGEIPDRIADMSADGETIAFTTRAALVPADVNNGSDLYVWSHGAIGLITDGVTKFPAGRGQPSLVGVDETGANIFFTAAAGKLTGFERDGLSNYYDARIGGGFEPPEPAAHCQEESCQGPLQAPPGSSPARSAGFTGLGNVVSSPSARQRCQKKKGQAKRRCARVNHKQKKRSKRKHAHRKSEAGK
jgi:hypothetical protein